MAIDLDDLFTTKLQPIIEASRSLNGYRGSAAPYPDPATVWGSGGPVIKDLTDAIADIMTGFDGGDFEDIIDGLPTDAATHRTAQKAFLTKLQTYARNTVIGVVNADSPLASKTIALAMAELRRQMLATSDSVNASAPAVAVAADAGNTGDAKAAATVKGPDGVNREYILPEVITLFATSDSGLGATEGSEPFLATGEAAEADTLSQLWPGGSGTTASTSALDADGTANYLTNGGFDTFTVTNTPDSWTIQVGAATTDIFAAGSSESYGASGNALKFTGTGGNPLSQIWQALTTLRPNTIYGVCFRAKKSASLVAGVLSIDLYNGTTVITDDASGSNVLTTAYSALATSYAAFTTFFITPKVLPATVRFRVHVSTALTSGESVFVDHLIMAPATQLYTGGLSAAMFSGKTNTVKNDRYTLTATNTLGIFQEWFDRWFAMRATLGLQLPSNAAGAETLVDP